MRLREDFSKYLLQIITTLLKFPLLTCCLITAVPTLAMWVLLVSIWQPGLTQLTFSCLKIIWGLFESLAPWTAAPTAEVVFHLLSEKFPH